MPILLQASGIVLDGQSIVGLFAIFALALLASFTYTWRVEKKGEAREERLLRLEWNDERRTRTWDRIMEVRETNAAEEYRRSHDQDVRPWTSR